MAIKREKNFLRRVGSGEGVRRREGDPKYVAVEERPFGRPSLRSVKLSISLSCTVHMLMCVCVSFGESVRMDQDAILAHSSRKTVHLTGLRISLLKLQEVVGFGKWAPKEKS